jgi:hypothetical protein
MGLLLSLSLTDLKGIGNHRQRRGAARALAWDFLLKTAVSNSFILQRDGQPAWLRHRALSQWQEAVSDALCERYWPIYRLEAGSRKRYQAGDELTLISRHHWIDRGKRDQCKACQGIQIRPRTQSSQYPRNRRALGSLNVNSFTGPDPKPGRLEAPPAKWTTKGCDCCNVAICNDRQCWYFYHQPIY